jgi:adenylate cyclase
VAGASSEHKDVSVRGWSSHRVVRWLTGGHGRPVAIAVLILLAVFHVSLGEQSWSLMRHLLFDAYQRLMPRTASQTHVVIVDIDDASQAAFGRWPWPRTRLARLIEATHKLGALAVGLDMVMPEADSMSPALLLAERQDLNAEVRASLSGLSSNDAILAETLRRIPSVIGRAGIIDAKVQNTSMDRQTPVRVVGDLPLAGLQSYKAHLANIAEIEAAAFGRGYLNDTRDNDGVVRAMPLVIAINGQLAPSFALELLRVATGQQHYSVHGSRDAIQGIQIGTSLIPTDSQGRIRVYFTPAYARHRVSAGKILRGELAPNSFVNQIVIIGVAAIGITDVAATPIATRMDGIEIQAQSIENILDGAQLSRPPAIRWLELVALLIIALALILFLPRLRPSFGVAIFLFGAAVVWAASVISFHQFKVLFDPTFVTAGNALILTVLLTAGFSAADRRRRELDVELEAERVERFRMAGELQAAREIQMGMLPTPGAIAGLPPNVEFYAVLEPAQEVGGDLYDAFMLDERHFFFLIGDVSGKGVPASLFMALSKTLCKSLARREHVPLDGLMRLVNEEISSENPASLFVTAIMGILDVQKGELELCNAGHDAPILLRVNEPPRSLNRTGGPPLCVKEDFPYTFDRLQLRPEDVLVMITDGVTEAQDSAQNFYGLPRVLTYLTTMKERQRPAADACQGIYEDVKRFSQGLPPSDDITIVAVRFMTPEIPASIS